MKRSIWVFSILLATLFLLTYAGPVSTYLYPTGAVLAASSPGEPLNPSERKEIESLALEFTNHYYTYTQQNYLEEGKKLLPLLTQKYQEPYKELLERGYLASKAVQAESSVLSTQILVVEKTSPDLGFTYLRFKANVSNNGEETLNRYSTTLSLEREDGKWRINGILSEQPVEFLNIQNLL